MLYKLYVTDDMERKFQITMYLRGDNSRLMFEGVQEYKHIVKKVTFMHIFILFD